MGVLRPTLAVLVAALALAGCGSSPSGGGGGGDGDSANNNSAAYDAAFDICSDGVASVADAYGVEPTQDAVAEVIVEQLSGGSPQDEESIRKGCIAALDKAGAG